MENEKQEDETITVSKVYETLKSSSFLKKLYWDVLSDMKHKDAFKQMKETTEKLLNKKLETVANLNDNESDNLQRKTIVAEICSMTYAIDTVYSKILYIKLQKEFKSHIIDAIKDLRKERKIPDSVWSKLQMPDDPLRKESTENSASKNNSLQQKPETSSRPVRNKRKKITPVHLATKNSEIRSEIHEDLKAINSDEGKVDLTRKKLRSVNQAVPKPQTSTSVQNIPKKRQTVENQTTSKVNTVTRNKKENKAMPKEVQKINDPAESDAESEVSDGDLSLSSVSSVHTSDLSTYDDEISLSSEDENYGTKKRMSLKELKEMCNKGRLSDTFNGSSLKNTSGILKSSVDKADNAADSGGSSTESKSPTQKSFPKRIRKPNSKYSSENILCTITKVKGRKKLPNTPENEKNSSLAQKRSRNDASDSDEENVSKMLKTTSDKEDKQTKTNGSRQSSSSELYKPNFPVRSLTSRRTTPVIMYST